MNYRALIAEFVGTFALIFVGVGSIAVSQMTHEVGVVGVALAHGLTIMVMVSALGMVRGGHFNPAVTAGVLASRRILVALAVAYWVVQLLGGIAGAVVDKLVFPTGALNPSRSAPPRRQAASPGTARL